MKVRIPKIALSLVLALPASCAAVHYRADSQRKRCHRHAFLFYANVPDQFSDVVTNFKMLPERMNPTRSECN